MEISKIKSWDMVNVATTPDSSFYAKVNLSFHPQVNPIDAALLELKGLLAEQIASGKASESGYYRATVNNDGSLTIAISPTPPPSDE